MTNKGIALIQILLIVAIISILALYFTQTARHQLKIAQLSNNRAEAWLMLKSAQSKLFIALLTEHREPNKSASDEISRVWNFYNRPFPMNENVAVKIQDQSGLVSVQFPDLELLVDVFKENGLNVGGAPVLIDGLLDWQDADRLTRLNGLESYEVGPRNSSISLRHELLMVNGMSPQVWQRLGDVFTLYRRGPFNPLTAPDQVINGLLGRDKGEEYISKRQRSPMTLKDFTDITNLQENMEQIFYPGEVMEIRLVANKGEVDLAKTLMVEFKPYATGVKSPIDYLEVKW